MSRNGGYAVPIPHSFDEPGRIHAESLSDNAPIG